MPISIRKNISIFAFEKSTVVAVQILTSLVLVQLLTPEDFGLVEMLTFFVALGNMLVDAGFGGSLIYYQDADERDFISVFWLYLGVKWLDYSLILRWLAVGGILYIFGHMTNQYFLTKYLRINNIK